MGKSYIPKRDNKKTTLEQFHVQLQENKPRKQEIKNKVANQDSKFERRHRYKKHNIKLQEIDLSVAKKISEIKLLPDNFDEDEMGSFFFDTLQAIKNDNSFSSSFNSVYFELVDISQTLPIILSNLQNITDILIKNLVEYPNEILNLFRDLIRDTRDEIYQIFINQIFDQIISMIIIEKIEIMELIFQTISSSIRYLSKCIQNDFQTFYKMYKSSLLDHKNKHVKKFACTVLSWLLKKTKNQKILLDVIMESFEQQEINYKSYFAKISSLNEQEVIAYLLLESVKGLNNQLTNNYQQTLKLIGSYKKSQVQMIFIFFCIQEIKQGETQLSLEQLLLFIYEKNLFKFIEVSQYLIQYKYGKFINQQIVDKIMSFCNDTVFMSSLLKNRPDLINQDFTEKISNINNLNQIHIFYLNFLVTNESDKVLRINSKYYVSEDQFKYLLFSLINNISLINFKEELDEQSSQILYWFYMINKINSLSQIQLKQKLEFKFYSQYDKLVKIKFMSLIKNQQFPQSEQIQLVQQANYQYSLENMYNLQIKKYDYIKQDQLDLAIYLQLLTKVDNIKVELLDNIQYLNLLADYQLELKADSKIKDQLLQNLSCQYSIVRSSSLRVLMKLENEELLQYLIEIEELRPSLETERSIIKQLYNLQSKIENRQLNEFQQQILVNYLCGFCYVRLQTLWSHISILLKNIVAKYQFSFNIYFQHLIKLNYLQSINFESTILNQDTIFEEDYYLNLDAIDHKFVLKIYCEAYYNKNSQIIEQFIINYIHNSDNKLMEMYFKILLHQKQLQNQQFFLEQFMNYLRRGNENLQAVCLDCVIKFTKNIQIKENFKVLKSLQNDKTYKSEMVLFDHQLYNDDYLELVISILYSNLFSKKGDNLENNRGIVFNFFSGLKAQQIKYLVDLLLKSYEIHQLNQNNFNQIDIESFKKIDVKKWIGLLNTLKQFVKQLGQLLLPYISHIWYIVLFLQKSCIDLRLQDSIENKFTLYKQIQKLCIKRYEQFFEKYQSIQDLPYIVQTFISINKQKFDKFSQEAIDSESGLLRIIKIWSLNKIYHIYFDTSILSSLIDTYKNIQANKQVIETINIILIQVFSENEYEKQIQKQMICNLTILFQHQSKKQKWKPSSTQIELLIIISQFDNDQEDLDKLLNLLSFMLELKFLQKNIKQVADKIPLSLQILKIVSNLTSNKQNHLYFNQCLSLLTNLQNKQMRLLIIQILENSDANDQNKQALDLLKLMNTFDRKSLDNTLDYEVVLPACFQFNTEYIKQWNQTQIQIILNHYFHLICEQELSVRLAALSGFEAYFQMENQDFSQKYLNLLAQNFKRYSNAVDEFKIKNMLQILQFYLKFNKQQQYKDLNVLFNTDLIQCFFDNILDISLSKRIRGFQILDKFVDQISFDSLQKFIIPIIQNQIFIKSKEILNKKNKISKSQSIIQQYQKLQKQAIQTYSLCVKQARFNQKQKIFKFLISRLETKDQEKIIIKMIVEILNTVEFKNDIVDTVQKIDMEIEDDNVVEEEDRIQKFFINRVLQPLKIRMFEKVDDNKKKIRVGLTVAIVRLIRNLKQKIFLVEFPKIIGNIIVQLRSREADDREQARKALLQIAKMLGPMFLHYIIKEMSQQLKLGYQVHVCNYTLNYILNQMDIQNGELDYTLNSLIPLLNNELFGELQEEKEAEDKTKKYMEVKKNKAQETYQLVARTINFQKSFLVIISFLQYQMKSDNQTKTFNKIDDIFRYILEGLSKNESLDLEHVLIYCYTLINDAFQNIKINHDLIELNECLVKDVNKQHKLTKYDVLRIQPCAAEGKSIFKMLNTKSKQNDYESARILAGFSLRVLSNFLKKQQFQQNQIQDQQNLKQLLNLVIDCLDSINNAMVSNALKVIHYMIKWDIVKPKLGTIFDKVLNILQKLNSQDTEMVKFTFVIITDLLEIKNFIDDQQLFALFKFMEVFMFESELVVEPLNCFKMLIIKKYEYPQIYDLIEKLSERMIKTHAQNIRSICKTIFLMFLTDYPISEKLLQKYIYMIVKNFDYEGSGERFVIFDIMSILVKQFPQVILDHYSDLFYYSLLIRISKEQDPENQKLIQESLISLRQRLSKDKLQFYKKVSLEWIQDQKLSVQFSGFYSLNILLNHQIKLEDQQIQDATNKIDFIIQESIEELKIRQQNYNNNQVTLWMSYLKDDEDVLKYQQLLSISLKFIQNNKLQQRFQSQIWPLFSYPDMIVVDTVLQICNDLFKVNQVEQESFAVKKILYLNFNYNLEKQQQIKIQNVVIDVLKSMIKKQDYESIGKILSYIEIYCRKALAKLSDFTYVIQRLFQIIKRFINDCDSFNNELILDKTIQTILRFQQAEVLADDTEEIVENLKKKVDINLFFKTYAKTKKQIDDFKNERKRVQKETMILDPQQSAQDKIKRNLNKKKVKNNKILKMKGLKKVKLN